VGQAIVFRGLPTHTPHYFDGVAAVAALFFFGAFLDFFMCFLVLTVVAACVPLLLVAGVAGVDCANVMGMVATASAIASKLFFIFPSFRRAFLPAHNSMVRWSRSKHDSLRRLVRAPNSR
jgi:hypothetical protein